MSFLIGAILPPLTIIIFSGGLIYRIYTWKTLPSPPMTLFPAPKSYGQRFINILKETFLFSKLFHGDRILWLLGGFFHFMLAITFIDHYDRILAYMGLTGGSVFKIPFISGGPTGIAILICAVLIIVRRFTVKRAAQISSFGDYFALLLILAVVLTGDALRFMSHFDVVRMREYFSGLLTFSYNGLPENTLFIIHYLLSQILIIYIPFSKILHFGGIFFSQAAIHKY